MAVPIAYFGFSREGKTIHLDNLSSNSPNSYQWDFGDGDTSQDKNPVHTYNSAGFYKITLVATNSEGSSEPLEITVVMGDSENMLNSSIIETIKDYVPKQIFTGESINSIANLIGKWQLYLQPLVITPFKVKEKDTYNETKWPVLTNVLIAQLVAYDFISQNFSKFLIDSGLIGENKKEEEKEQEVKSIETGPAKTEWFEKSKESSSESIKNLALVYNYLTKKGGLVDNLLTSACQLSKRVDIYLPICGQLDNTTLPKVFVKPKKNTHNANPFGITKRML